MDRGAAFYRERRARKKARKTSRTAGPLFSYWAHPDYDDDPDFHDDSRRRWVTTRNGKHAPLRNARWRWRRARKAHRAHTPEQVIALETAFALIVREFARWPDGWKHQHYFWPDGHCSCGKCVHAIPWARCDLCDGPARMAKLVKSYTYGLFARDVQ